MVASWHAVDGEEARRTKTSQRPRSRAVSARQHDSRVTDISKHAADGVVWLLRMRSDTRITQQELGACKPVFTKTAVRCVASIWPV